MKHWHEMLTDYPERSKLIGGYACQLSTAEVNEWTEYIQQFTEYESFVIEELKLQQLVKTGTPVSMSIREQYKSARSYERALYELGKSWYAGLVARRAGVVPVSED